MRDPAFLFYDGDAARDVSHMNRLERGCYFDLIQAQRKFHGYSMEQVRKFLGNDFESCWEPLKLILSTEIKDGKTYYFIEWVRNSIEKREKHSEKQRERIQNYWNEKRKNKDTTVIPRNNHGNAKEDTKQYTKTIPLENENENENENIKNKEEYEEKKENTPSEILTPSDAEILYAEIICFFSEDLQPKSEEQKLEWIGALDKLIRIDGHSPEKIKQVIESTRKDDFWKSNFLSVLKLRRKDKDGNMYFTVFKNRINGNNRTDDSGRIKRVNALWDRKN